MGCSAVGSRQRILTNPLMLKPFPSLSRITSVFSSLQNYLGVQHLTPGWNQEGFGQECRSIFQFCA